MRSGMYELFSWRDSRASWFLVRCGLCPPLWPRGTRRGLR